MTNREIFIKAQAKAKTNNWAGFVGEINVELIDCNFSTKSFFNNLIIKHVIFSHDFAKAFWGEKYGWYSVPWSDGTDEVQVQSYEYHLMCMVLMEEPLKYIEKFL